MLFCKERHRAERRQRMRWHSASHRQRFFAVMNRWPNTPHCGSAGRRIFMWNPLRNKTWRRFWLIAMSTTGPFSFSGAGRTCSSRTAVFGAWWCAWSTLNSADRSNRPVSALRGGRETQSGSGRSQAKRIGGAGVSGRHSRQRRRRIAHERRGHGRRDIRRGGIRSPDEFRWQGAGASSPGAATAYRSCPALKTHIALAAVLCGHPGSREAIEQRMNEFSRQRWNTQPAAPSAGCMFKNPPSIPAGRLIDDWV